MAYQIVFALLKLLSRLPFWCLHRISAFFYILLYYIIRYRRKVILNNLAIAFPHHSLSENKKIAKKFIRHFADILIESIKVLSISKNQLQNHNAAVNTHLIQKEIDKGKNIMVVAGHFNNWEWLLQNEIFSGVMSWTPYTPLSNPIFDKLMISIRERFEFSVVPSKKAADLLTNSIKEGTQFINLLLADQSPPSNYKYRTAFFNKDVPFFIGPEAYAKKYDLAVFYASMKKIARSKYTVELIPITHKPKDTEPNWITSEYIRLLEKDIRTSPEHYLWSHRRFKHAGIS